VFVSFRANQIAFSLKTSLSRNVLCALSRFVWTKHLFNGCFSLLSRETFCEHWAAVCALVGALSQHQARFLGSLAENELER
jgi:hypothetical protein